MVAKDARILAEVPLASAVGTGTRVIAADGDDLYHVFLRRDGDTELSPQQTFNLAGARETARKVLAGDPLASTSPGTLRILAAAVLVEETADYAFQLATATSEPASADDGKPSEEVDEPEAEVEDGPEAPSNGAKRNRRKRGSTEWREERRD